MTTQTLPRKGDRAGSWSVRPGHGGTRETPVLTGEPMSLRWDSLSPLRYPGSKRKMLPALRELITGNIPRPRLLVEPFCGGASVSLGLLEHDLVDHVILGDLDPLVASFWQQAASNHEALIEAMHKEPVTLERWDFWRNTAPRAPLRKALKLLFLSRTSFSGIIHSGAGPIGGRSQKSKYKIDCRFNKDAIERRIRTVADLAKDGRILAVTEGTWQETIRRSEYHGADFESDETLLYLDPPYVEKSSSLYELGFTQRDHDDLARYLIDDTTHRWILSYDAVPEVLEMYRGLSDIKEYLVSHAYTMRGRGRSSAEPGREVIFTNLPSNPVQGEDAHQRRVAVATNVPDGGVAPMDFHGITLPRTHL